jgi:3-hydroxyisobutyrate dehydrogenase-like beta-hydroxyacid dehydrogenase
MVVNMKIGFIGFGEVASTLAMGLLKQGIIVSTCIKGRSQKTHKIVEKLELDLCESNKELAETSDFLISAVTPASAIKIAQDVGEYVKGIYVDINNISPSTAKKSLSLIKNGKIVDASIIGTIRNGINVPIIASGPYADEFCELNKYGMNITVIGSDIGQASAIKILRSAFTKGISALLFETLYPAYEMGIDQEVLKYIAETEGEEFEESAKSRIISSAFHADRRYEEMNEVIELLEETENPKISKATQDFYKELHEKVVNINKRPENYLELFDLIKKLKDYR